MVKANMAKKKGALKKTKDQFPASKAVEARRDLESALRAAAVNKRAGEIIAEGLKEAAAGGKGEQAPARDYAWVPVVGGVQITAERAAADAAKDAAIRRRRWLQDAGPSALAAAVEAIGATTPNGAALKVTVTVSITGADSGTERATATWEG